MSGQHYKVGDNVNAANRVGPLVYTTDASGNVVPVGGGSGVGGGDASAANQATQISLATSANTKLDTLNSRYGPVSWAPSSVLTITTGGTVQTLFSSGTLSRGFRIVNNSFSDMWIRYDGSAPSQGVGFYLSPNGGFIIEDVPPTSAVQVFCATTGASYYAVGA